MFSDPKEAVEVATKDYKMDQQFLDNKIRTGAFKAQGYMITSTGNSMRIETFSQRYIAFGISESRRVFSK